MIPGMEPTHALQVLHHSTGWVIYVDGQSVESDAPYETEADALEAGAYYLASI